MSPANDKSDLKTISVSNLDVMEAPRDLRRDLLIFVEYIADRAVKRLTRSNGLPKADVARLAKLIADSEAIEQARHDGQSEWIDFVDNTALRMGFIDYNTKGEYASYNSTEPSYPDNYISFNQKGFDQFLQAPLIEQEHRLLEVQISELDGCQSEFFRRSALGRLDRFPSWTCEAGVIPNLDFPAVRRFLLEQLQTCETGLWLNTDSFIAHLKAQHPYFLIPKKPNFKKGWFRETHRYCNFQERSGNGSPRDDIRETDPDAFERVEGRYIERFLEGTALTMGYIDVAYTQNKKTGVYPNRGHLKAFRVHDRLRQVMTGEIPEPTVIIQPNFEIFVESAFYPTAVLSKLRPLADVISDDVLTILKLQRQKVTTAVADDDSLDVIALLTDLSGQPLARNIERELTEWASQSEVFTLYDGFGLLEGKNPPAIAAEYTAKTISPKLRLVREPEALFAQMEAAETIPIRILHTDVAFSDIPQQARSLISQKKPVAQSKRQQRQSLILQRQTTITLQLPSPDALQIFRQAMLDARCPIEVNEAAMTITYNKQVEDQINTVLKGLGAAYNIDIQDV